MTDIIMHGCNGRMGQMITNIVKEDDDANIVAGIDIADSIKTNPYPVYTDIDLCDKDADVVIDFSSVAAIDNLLDYCEGRKLPLVLCSTGLSDEHLNRVAELSQKIAILKSPNMSLGINVLLKALKEVSKTLVPEGFDVEIVEQHHRTKVDAPSGTALALADAINEEFDDAFEYIYDRTGFRRKRGDREIGISSVRGGSIVGDHQVIFAGLDEVITIQHTAYSRAIFAKGAVAAAKFLKGKGPGLYNMSDVIG